MSGDDGVNVSFLDIGAKKAEKLSFMSEILWKIAQLMNAGVNNRNRYKKIAGLKQGFEGVAESLIEDYFFF